MATRTTDAQRARDNAARKAKRDAQRAAGTYRRPPDAARVWVGDRYVTLSKSVVDPDDYGHPESDVRTAA